MKQIRLLYFAQLRSERGVTEEVYRTEARGLRELYGELSRRYGLSLDFEKLRVAVNHGLVTPDQPFQGGDTVAFIPPVSGG